MLYQQKSLLFLCSIVHQQLDQVPHMYTSAASPPVYTSTINYVSLLGDKYYPKVAFGNERKKFFTSIDSIFSIEHLTDVFSAFSRI